MKFIFLNAQQFLSQYLDSFVKKKLPFVSLENNSAAVLCPVVCINDITNKTEKCGKGMTYIGLNRDLNWQLLKPRSIAITVQPYYRFRWQITFFVSPALRIGCLIFLSLLVFRLNLSFFVGV